VFSLLQLKFYSAFTAEPRTMKLQVSQALPAPRLAKSLYLYQQQQVQDSEAPGSRGALALSTLAAARDFTEVTSRALQLPSKHMTKICKANWFLILSDDKQQKISVVSVITIHAKFSIYCKVCVVGVLEFQGRHFFSSPKLNFRKL